MRRRWPTAGYVEKWVAYAAAKYSAKELTVFPGRSTVIRDAAPYGLIVVQGLDPSESCASPRQP